MMIHGAIEAGKKLLTAMLTMTLLIMAPGLGCYEAAARTVRVAPPARTTLRAVPMSGVSSISLGNSTLGSRAPETPTAFSPAGFHAALTPGLRAVSASRGPSSAGAALPMRADLQGRLVGSVNGLALSHPSSDPESSAASDGAEADFASAPGDILVPGHFLSRVADDLARFPKWAGLALGRIYDGSPQMIKPRVESWTVKGRRYDSTGELVRHLPLLAGPQSATYHFGHEERVEEWEQKANAKIAPVAGGLIGAAVGALAMLFVGAFHTAAPVVAIGYGMTIPLTVIAGAVAFGFSGAVMGYFGSGRDEPRRTSILGVIYRHAGPEGRKLLFARADNSRVVVDLAAYAQAKTPEAAPRPKAWPWWKGALHGSGIALAIAVSMIIPFVQVLGIFSGPFVAGAIGNMLTKPNHVTGGLLGGSLGLIIPFSWLLMGTIGGNPLYAGDWGLWLNWLSWFGVMGVIGAVLGALLANPLRRAQAWANTFAPAGQWWTREKKKAGKRSGGKDRN